MVIWWASVSTSLPTLNITGSVNGVALQSIVAAQRYGMVHKLEKPYPEWMLLKVLLAEVHYLMNDSFGAAVLLSVVQDAIGYGKDQHLDRAVEELFKIVEAEGDEEEEEEKEEGITVVPYKRPGRFSSVQCSWSVEGVQKAWQVLEQTKTLEAVAEFARYIAISTNVLEGVFSIDGQSMSKLVKRGFYANSIEGISATSRIKKKDKIMAILKNTESCLQYLHRDIAFDVSMIQGIHKTLMEGDNLSFEKNDEDQDYVSFVPCGVYRRVACFARHPRHNKETRYCPSRHVPEEMQWYIQEAQIAISDNSADPRQTVIPLYNDFNYIVIIA